MMSRRVTVPYSNSARQQASTFDWSMFRENVNHLQVSTCMNMNTDVMYWLDISMAMWIMNYGSENKTARQPLVTKMVNSLRDIWAVASSEIVKNFLDVMLCPCFPQDLRSGHALNAMKNATIKQTDASWMHCWVVFEIKSCYQANVTLPRSTFSTSLWTSIMLSEIFQTRIYTPLEDLPLFWQKSVQQMDMLRVIKYKIFFQITSLHAICQHLNQNLLEYTAIFYNVFS